MCGDYSHHFVVKGKDVSGHARHFLTGLLGKERRKNIERIEADVAESDYQGMQQFISDSPWSHEALLDQVAKEADGLLGGHGESALILDETSFVKKGNASVGVQRQYCGRLGKLENCQVGVFACLGRGRFAALVDFRLYLPEDWVSDEARCKRAKVPAHKREHFTKPQLALQMVQAARARHSTHGWVGGDEVYGNNQELCAQLEDMGETFLMDVARNTRVWTAEPHPERPSSPSAPADLLVSEAASAPVRGRPRSRMQATNAEAKEIKIEQLVAQNFAHGSRQVTIRHTTQGELQARVWVREVWLWDYRWRPQVRRRLLVVRQEADGSFKYSLSNAAAQTSWEKLAFMQAQRYWIEQSFKEAKSELGMAHYEVRGWKGWHHHMALVCLAQLFTVRERLTSMDELPLLSARDIVELLALYLPRRQRDEAEVLRQLQARHENRRKSAASHARRQRRQSLKT